MSANWQSGMNCNEIESMSECGTGCNALGCLQSRHAALCDKYCERYQVMSMHDSEFSGKPCVILYLTSRHEVYLANGHLVPARVIFNL